MNLKFSEKQKLLLAWAFIFAFAGLFIFVNKLKHGRQNMIKNEALVTSEDTMPLAIPTTTTKSLHLPILMYHHIGDPPPVYNATRYDLTVSIKNFQEQVKWLKDNGYTSISLADFYQSLKSKFVLPKKPIILSFDDGYGDAFLNAIPILKQNGFTGTFAIITNYPGETSGTNFYASWQQIIDAKEQGMEIICHTQNHFDAKNPKYTAEYMYQNYSGCQKDIVGHLGQAYPFLVYPYGHYTDTSIAQAKKVGFVFGITIHEGSFINLNDLMHIPRVRVHRDESIETLAKMLQK